MSRNSTIRVSDDEKKRLGEATKQIYGTDSVPYGETIGALIDIAVDDSNPDDENDGFDGVKSD